MVLTSFIWQGYSGSAACSKAQSWTWKSMGAYHPRFVYCSQSQRYVYSRAHQELERLLFGFEANLHPIIDWILSTTWYELVRILLFAESSWKWAPDIFYHNLTAWVPRFYSWPSQPQHICLLAHRCFCDPQAPCCKRKLICKKIWIFELGSISNDDVIIILRHFLFEWSTISLECI